MLSVRNLSIWNGRTPICRETGFDVHPGEVVVLIAPNGTGKTTVLQAIGGGARPHFMGRLKGSCIADEIEKARNPIEYRKKVLYVASDGALLNKRLTVYEHLVAAKRLWKSDCSILEMVRACKIEGFLGSKVNRLSQGMRQRASLAVALAAKTPYLLLDEPTNGLDQSNVDLFWELVGKRARTGVGIVLATHILAGIDGHYDRIFSMEDGQIRQQDAGKAEDSCKAVYGKLYQQAG